MQLRLITFIMMMLVAGNAWSKPIAIFDIQEILLKSRAGNKAKEIISEVRIEKERIKLAKDNELRELKSSNDQMFSSKLVELSNFMTNAQNELQAINDKLTNYLVDAIIQITIKNCKSKYASIYSFNRKKEYYDIITSKRIPGVDTHDSQNITQEVLALFDKESNYYDSLVLKSPYILSANTGDSPK